MVYIVLGSFRIFVLFFNNFCKSFLSAEEALRPEVDFAKVQKLEDLKEFRIVTVIDTNNLGFIDIPRNEFRTSDMEMTRFGGDVYSLYVTYGSGTMHGFKNPHLFKMINYEHYFPSPDQGNLAYYVRVRGKYK